MIEMMGKIAICLIIALLLGFVIGWFFAKALRSEKETIELDIEEGENRNDLLAKIAQLKQQYEAEQAISESYKERHQSIKKELMSKLAELDAKQTMIHELETSNPDLASRRRVKDLEQALQEKNAELKEFELVLIKAEETIERKEAYIKQLLQQ